MSSKKLKAALDDPKRQARTSRSHLAQIFWMIVDNYGLNWAKWERCINRYVNNPNVCVQIPRRKSERRNNLHIALTNKEALSWSKLIEGITAIDIRRMKITIETWRGESEQYGVVQHEIDLRVDSHEPEQSAKKEGKSNEQQS